MEYFNFIIISAFITKHIYSIVNTIAKYYSTWNYKLSIVNY